MQNDCVFCDYAGPSEILREDDFSFIIEPTDPVTPGHVLVVSKVHIPDFVYFGTMGRVVEAAGFWVRDHRPEDWNLITSKGRVATQTVMHLHVHLVPRRPNDGLKLPWSDG